MQSIDFDSIAHMDKMWIFRVSTFSLFLIVIFIEASTGTSTTLNEEERAAEEFLSNYDILIKVLKNEQTKAVWNYETNITEENKNFTLEVGAKYALFDEEAFQVIVLIFSISLSHTNSILVKRVLHFQTIQPL